MESQIIIAPCGLICSHCDAWRATQMNDPEKLEMVAAKWRELNQTDEIKAEYLPCDGCMTKGGRKNLFCSGMCEIRKCIIKRGIQICSDCPDFEGCRTFSDFISHGPAGQAEAMRRLQAAVADVKKNMTSAF